MTTDLAGRFKSVVGTYGPRIVRDLGIEAHHAAGIFGNGAVESKSFTDYQEDKPLVAGSLGGFGWMQWTGPRRRQYMAYCQEHGLDPNSDEAQYAWLVVELQTTEKASLAALKQTKTVRAAAETFMKKNLRPGIPHLDARIKAANLAYPIIQEALGGAAAPALPDPADLASAAPAPVAGSTRRWTENSLARYEVEAIQKRLRDLGYYMVGKVDGIWGPSTSGALIALQTQAGITPDGHWGPQSKAALDDDANKRRVDPARASTTAADLRAQGSVIAIQGSRVTWSSVWQIVLGAMGIFQYLAQNWQGDLSSLPFPASLILGFLPPWVAPVLIILLNVYNALAAQGIVKARVVAERTGLHNGEPDPSPSPPVTMAPDGPRLGGILGSLFGTR